MPDLIDFAEPNPRRVTAGKLNRVKRGAVSPEGRQRLRNAALRDQPWSHSTGPRTAAGKARAAANGKLRQVGPKSVRELRAELADVRAMIQEMRKSRVTTHQPAAR